MQNQNKTSCWHVGEDDVGRPVLQWDADTQNLREAGQESDDPLANTFNFLKRLELPDLGLERDVDDKRHDPYDSGT